MVAATAVAVFTPASPLATNHFPMGFLAFPVLVWPVVRFGPRLAVTTAAVLSVVAVWGALDGAGPFVRESENGTEEP